MGRSWGIAVGASIVVGVWLGLAGFLVLAICLVIATGLTGRPDWRFFSVLALCVGLGVVRGSTIEATTLPEGVLSSSGAVVEVIGSARPDATGDTVRARVFEFVRDDVSTSGDNAIVLLKLPAGVTVARGDRLEIVSWTLSPPESFSPGYASYLHGLGAAARAEVRALTVISQGIPIRHWFAELRREVTVRLREAVPGDAGALAAGIVTGDDSSLSDEAEENFRSTGTSHITAVSGSNVAMVIAIWMAVVPAGRSRRRLVVQITIILSILAYWMFVGGEPPVSRAAIVASFALLAGRAGRQPDVMTLLSFSAAVLVLWQPENVHLASYWLSIVASVAIASRVPVESSAGPAAVIRGLFEGTIFAQIATLPLVLVWFGSFSGSGIVANVLLAPLMWVAFPCCFLLAAVTMIVPVLTPVFAVVPTIVLEAALSVVHALAALAPPVTPGAAGPMLMVLVGVPCLLTVAALSRDGQRWSLVLQDRLRKRPLQTLSMVVAPGIGIVVAAILAVARW